MSKNISDLKNKILFTLAILLIYRFGTFVPIPGVDIEVLRNFFSSDKAKLFGMVNLFSGGALERMSIFALNIMPYITASIIMQLMTSMYKGLAELKKDGEYGRAKINQYTRYLTIILAIFQSLGVYYASVQGNIFISDSPIFLYTTCVSLVGGTVMLMWFGERITASGIGNGISLIIFVGIVSSLPSTIAQMFDLSRTGVYSWFALIFFIVALIAFFMFICFVEKTYRKIKIQYPNASLMRSSGMQDSSFLPLKINISGVIPPIFASSVLTFPSAFAQFSGLESDNFFVTALARGGSIYLILFAVLILFFSYFYSSIVFNSDDVSSNLKKSNCFILGIRPGKATSDYLNVIVNRLTLIGAIYLIIICIVPEIVVTRYSIPLATGGTGILIMVNVVLDLVNQIQSHLFSSQYGSDKPKRRRMKIRQK